MAQEFARSYQKIMADAVTAFTKDADKALTTARNSAYEKDAAIVCALYGIGNALLAQCVLLERIADRLDEGGIGVEVTQA